MPGPVTMFHQALRILCALLVCAMISRLRAAAAQPTLVVQWNQELLQAVRDSRLGPPMVARALAIAHTCIYDAWAPYDNRAVGTVLGDTLRRPANERRPANLEAAISF